MDHIYGAKTICGKFVHEDSSKIPRGGGGGGGTALLQY